MWLFHFRVAGELQTGSKVTTRGIGHAMRCLSIIDIAREKYGIKSTIITNINEESKILLKNRSEDIYPEIMLGKLLSDNIYKAVISDINYLEEEVFNI